MVDLLELLVHMLGRRRHPRFSLALPWSGGLHIKRCIVWIGEALRAGARRTPRRRLVSMLFACTAQLAAPCQAQTPAGWNVEVSSDRAWTTYNGFDAAWTTERVQVSRSVPKKNGWFGGIERQTRYGLVDVAIFSRAYWRAGRSTWLVGGAATPDATFLYRASVEAEFSRRVVSSLVASTAYRYLGFRAVDIHQLQPALTWYHSRGEVEGRVFLSHNAAFGRTSPTALVRAAYAVSPRLRFAGAVSYGDRIFDVASLPTGTARAHLSFASVRLGLTRHDAVEVGASFAHEAPAFDYRSVSVGYRRLF